MSITVVLIIIALISYLVSEWLLRGEKFLIKRIVIVTLSMIFTAVFSYYDSNKPLSYEDTFYFSKNILSNASLTTENDHLQYGEFRIMESLESLFRQSWLPNIKKTDNSTYIEPNFMKNSRIINEVQLKDVFKDNQFIKKISYYHLSLPPNMRIAYKAEKGTIGGTTHINFNSKWTAIDITLPYLSPDKMIYGELYCHEKWPLVFSSSKRKEYRKWFLLLKDELKNIHKWDKMAEDILGSKRGRFQN